MPGRKERDTRGVTWRAPEELLARLERAYRERGHTDRSSLITEAVRRYLDDEPRVVRVIVDGIEYELVEPK
jgi:metal-responsive CopG/Arc/MetJ family transcriptional regulator